MLAYNSCFDNVSSESVPNHMLQLQALLLSVSLVENILMFCLQPGKFVWLHTSFIVYTYSDYISMHYTELCSILMGQESLLAYIEKS